MFVLCSVVTTLIISGMPITTPLQVQGKVILINGSDLIVDFHKDMKNHSDLDLPGYHNFVVDKNSCIVLH